MHAITLLLVVLLGLSAISILVGAVGGTRLLLAARADMPRRGHLVAAVAGFTVALVLMVAVLVIGSTQLIVIATAS